MDRGGGGNRRQSRRRDYREAKEDLDYRRDLYVPAAAPSSSTGKPAPDGTVPVILTRADPSPNFRRSTPKGSPPTPASPAILLKAPNTPSQGMASPVPQPQQTLYSPGKPGAPSQSSVKNPVPGASTPVQSPQPVIQLLPQPMREKIKLLDENFRYQKDDVLKALCDQTDFLVIGVLGKQGVGKSAIMSQLCSTPEEYKSRQGIFPRQSYETQIRAGHETTGIDMYCTPERMILLDVQPILSPSAMLAWNPLNQDKFTAKHEYSNAYEIQCLRLGLFLFSICHVILVVQDTPFDLPLWQFIRNVELLKHKIIDPGTAQPPTAVPVPTPADALPSFKKGDFLPELVFVVNKARPEDFSWDSFHRASLSTETFFKFSEIKMRGRIQMPPDLPCFNVESSARPFHFFLLPREDPPNHQLKTLAPKEDGSSPFQAFAKRVNDSRPASFLRLSTHLRNQVFGVPKRSYPQPPSERDWFRNAGKIWRHILSFELLRKYQQIINESLVLETV